MAKKKADNKSKDILDAIRSKFGDGSVIQMSGAPARQYNVVSTGSIGLDRALGIGGLPRGRIVEVYGPESSGKTTLTLHVVAEAQKLGLRCAFIDAEHALDVTYAQALGVNVADLLISQPDYGEQALEICDMLAHSGEFGVVVVDSVAALTPKAELEGEVGDSHVGLQARMMGQALRKMTAAANRGDTLIVFINQIRHKIGVQFGSPETTSGGNALKYYSSVRLDIRRIGGVKSGEEMTANRTRVKVKKNKTAPPFKEAEFDIDFGHGISRAGEIVELGVATGIVEKSGSWISYKNQKLGQGRENAKAMLRENSALMEELAQAIAEQ